MSLETIPMLVLSLLLLTTGGGGVGTAEVVLGGDHEIAGREGALVVADADARVTVPAGARIRGPVHVLGGRTRLVGTVEGDVTHLGGHLVVDGGARITGTLQAIGGTLEVDSEADIARRTSVALAPAEPGPVRRVLPVLTVTALLALVAAWSARRRARALHNIVTAVRRHPVVSLTAGGLLTVTGLALVVFMAFTIVLAPVALLGVAVALGAVGFGVVGLGSLVACRLPLAGPGRAAAAGVAVVVAALQAIGAIPVVGAPVVGADLMTGLGAVVLTYFGLTAFTPASIPE